MTPLSLKTERGRHRRNAKPPKGGVEMKEELQTFVWFLSEEFSDQILADEGPPREVPGWYWMVMNAGSFHECGGGGPCGTEAEAKAAAASQ